MKTHFWKYHGTGNDFVMIDDRDGGFPAEDHKLVAQLCDRRFGIGADGLILLQKRSGADFYMKYYNSDGNISSMCGNGGRCIAAFAHRLGIVNDACMFIAADGAHEAIITGKGDELMIRLKMLDVSQVERADPDTFILNTGSPHFVRFVTRPVEQLALVENAKDIRYNDRFKKEGINVNFANVKDHHSIEIRTYERGVEDETYSCGTGVTASALAAALLNRFSSGVHSIKVKVKGGVLQVQFSYHKEKQSFTSVWLNGPATFVFEGDVYL